MFVSVDNQSGKAIHDVGIETVDYFVAEPIMQDNSPIVLNNSVPITMQRYYRMDPLRAGKGVALTFSNRAGKPFTSTYDVEYGPGWTGRIVATIHPGGRVEWLGALEPKDYTPPGLFSRRVTSHSHCVYQKNDVLVIVQEQRRWEVQMPRGVVWSRGAVSRDWDNLLVLLQDKNKIESRTIASIELKPEPNSVSLRKVVGPREVRDYRAKGWVDSLEGVSPSGDELYLTVRYLYRPWLMVEAAAVDSVTYDVRAREMMRR